MCRSFRQDGKVKKETIANLSGITEDQARAIQQILRSDNLVKQNDVDLEILHSAAHGHAEAVLLALKKIQIDKLLDDDSDNDRDLRFVKVIIVCDVLLMEPRYALIRDYHDTTLGKLLKLEKMDEQEPYSAMDWLYQHKDSVEKKLAQRHLVKSSRTVTSLSKGYLNDDLEFNFKLITDDQGCLVSAYAYRSNALISISTFKKHLSPLWDTEDFPSVILVEDRIKIPQKMIDKLTESKDINCIAGIKTENLRDLLDGTNLTLESIFDQCDLVEIPHADYPEKKFIVWRNSVRKNLRKEEREASLNSTVRLLEEIKGRVNQGGFKKRIPSDNVLIGSCVEQD